MEKKDETLSNIERLNVLLKRVDRITFTYKLVSVIFGLATLGMFVLYYYVGAPISSYIISGGAYAYILYVNLLRLSELRLLKMEIKMLIDCYNYVE